MSKELSSSRLVIPFEVDGDSILLAQRVARSCHYPEMWELPGGTVELGETVTHATVREAYEETGLIIPVGSLALLNCDRDQCRDDPNIPYSVFSFYSLQTEHRTENIKLDSYEHTDYTVVTTEQANNMNITPDSRRTLGHYAHLLANNSFELLINKQ